jgi:hypothetical protein
MLVFAPLSPRSACHHCDLAGRIPIAVKSGKDKTGYMLFGTRWKKGRDGLAPYGIAQVFVGFSHHEKPPMAYARLL